jgi:hypothetical protein
VKKLKLDLEALAVDSFEAAPADDDSRGTVHGASNESQYCGATIFEYIWNRTWLQQQPVV